MLALAILCVLAPCAGSDLDKQVSSVLPSAAENRWLEIPWRTELVSARVEARDQGKPLFLWTIYGHPLGPT